MLGRSFFEENTLPVSVAIFDLFGWQKSPKPFVVCDVNLCKGLGIRIYGSDFICLERPMKIALSGAHGTGKTTLVENVKLILTATHQIEICREVPRVIGDIADDREFFRREQNTLLRQCSIFLYQVIEDHMVQASADVVISDRTMVDHLAYTEVLFPEFKETTEYNVISKAVGVWLETYDKIVKVPIEFTVEDDGTREADSAFQRNVDEKIDELYVDFGIKPSSVTGSVSERTDQVVGLIGK